MLGRSPRIAGIAGLAAVLAVGTSEWVHWRASRRYLDAGSPSAPPAPRPPSPGDRGSEVVIVLGYPARRSGRPHPMQRWRCQIAVRSVNPERTSQLIFTGAAWDSGPSEAAVMAGYARDVLGVPAGQIALETQARTTWQNVEFTVPLAEQAGTIKFASDSLHAARARRYLRAQRPELAARLRAGDDYRFGERWWLKVATGAYELVRVLWRSRGLVSGAAAGRSRLGINDER
ncbi:MAG TPA: YdcF family protein [Streptosporangiaceae bacterium]